MKIGTDISLSTCIAEGYLIAKFKKGELLPKGILNPDAVVEFTRTFSEYDPLSGKLSTHACISANDVWERYQDAKEGIDSFADGPFDFPTNEYELLHLADSVDRYSGLN